jgi:hypothetical protein
MLNIYLSLLNCYLGQVFMTSTLINSTKCVDKKATQSCKTNKEKIVGGCSPMCHKWPNRTIFII